MPGPQASAAADHARALLDSVQGHSLADAQIQAHALELAAHLTTEATAQATRAERRRDAELAALMRDPVGQTFTTCMTDRILRSNDPARSVDAARYLVRRLGIPRYLPALARMQLGALRRLGPFFPERAAHGMRRQLRTQTEGVILDADPATLDAYLTGRKAQGVRVNVNKLGEAVLGETQAARRAGQYAELLAMPSVDAVSVKISSICSQLHLPAWEATLERLRPRLRKIYRAAKTDRKLVTLDMEAYCDLELTYTLFTSVLDEDEFLDLGAGIVLQAYIPDSHAVLQRLTRWAQERGPAAPVRLRIVKGANLAMERVNASLRGWAIPTFGTKREVDANYRNMIDHALGADGVRLGVASHNVFELSHAWVQAASRSAEDRIGFELLEGMADPLGRAVAAVGGELLVYGPIVTDDAFDAAIAYLMRRLDENTAEDNFLRRSFSMTVGNEDWHVERDRFISACEHRDVDVTPRRQQDRNEPPGPRGAGFDNEADTDFSRADNRSWAQTLMTTARDARLGDLASQVAGRRCEGVASHDGFDPSRPGHVPYRVVLATGDDIERALTAGTAAASAWSAQRPAQRAERLGRIADALRRRRAEFIGWMAIDAAKRLVEADVEVSEAIDFADYYAESYLQWEARDDVVLSPRGLTLVTPPWNFPLAIVAGGALAALMAGNTVILKPALETALVASRFAELCWEAGVPGGALQLLICEDGVGSRLIEDRRVAHVILTGATDTARLFQRMRPGLHLSAETGGKNALIVSAVSDRDLAARDAVHGAFGHAGQKCSATSLLVCEREVYRDEAFRRTLRDAAASLPVGSPWDLDSVVTPLIHPPRDPLLRGLTTLEDGEEWLLQPTPDPDNPCLWSPGIKLGVAEGSFCHRTEFFGPLLSVMEAEDLDHALRIANGTPFGLTAGLHSLDEREHGRFLERMEAGNLYVNRHTTGAIVRRQPFGGFKDSAFGSGAKAGGPNYVMRCATVSGGQDPEVVGPPTAPGAEVVHAAHRMLDKDQRRRLSIGAADYGVAWRTHFGVDHDPSQVLGQRNLFRYRPAPNLVIRAAAPLAIEDLLLACAAASTCGCDYTVSVAPGVETLHPRVRKLPITLHVEGLAECLARVRACGGPVRIVGAPEADLRGAIESGEIRGFTDPVLLCGRVELLNYLREQTVSLNTHRHGNLTATLHEA